jgi:HSP20 family protein
MSFSFDPHVSHAQTLNPTNFKLDPFFQMKPFSFNFDNKMNIEMKENDNEFIVNAELPGINKTNIDVTIENSILSITAEKNEVKEENTTKVHISERKFGKISRTVLIPKNVNIENIKAKYLDGILTITIPKETVSVSKSLKIE